MTGQLMMRLLHAASSLLALSPAAALPLREAGCGYDAKQDCAFPRRVVNANYSYPHYPKRLVYSLTGKWQFAFLNHTEWSANATTLPSDLSFDTTAQVPSAFDAKWGTGLQYSRGAGVYRAQVAIPVGQPAALHFEACSIYCRIFVDGTEVANNTAGGFTPFWVSIAAAKTSSRTLTVVASNVFDPVLTPTQAAYYDFYQYGGIIREATLHVLPVVKDDNNPVAWAPWASIQRVVVDPLAAAGGEPSGEVNVTIVLRDAPAVKQVQLWVCFDACPKPVLKQYAQVNGVVFLPAVAVPNFKVWSPASPKLHTLTVEVFQGTGPAVSCDSILVRFGLRTVKASGRHVLINGKPTKLHGYNRHDMFPQLGPSLTPPIYDADLKLLGGKQMEGNFIRGSHYPQDPRFLDRCDEAGVMVWEETLAWGNPAKILTEPAFLDASLATANAMLDRDTNHPAIMYVLLLLLLLLLLVAVLVLVLRLMLLVLRLMLLVLLFALLELLALTPLRSFWGFFNEGFTDDKKSCPAYEAMSKTFKGRDSTRLVTWADNRGQKGLCYEFADVVSNNYYPGWYNGPASGIKQTWTDRATWYGSLARLLADILSLTSRPRRRRCATTYPDKPFIISETGAGGILGQHSKNQSRWSLEYQATVDGDNADVAMADANIAGLTLWQFCDIKVDQSNTSSGRPGGINNKGVVSQWRAPKPAAAVVAAAYAKVAVQED